MSNLELLKRYLQNEIDTGSNTIFVFDKDYNTIEFNIIESLNEINNLQKQLQQKENNIKEVREILNNKREISVSQLLDRGYCDYEGLLYQVDEEIRRILDKENK